MLRTSELILSCLALVLLAGCGNSNSSPETSDSGRNNSENSKVQQPPSKDAAPPSKTPEGPLRTDGIYVAEGSLRYFLRFTDQEVWITAGKQSIAVAASIIGTEKNRRPQRGTYQLNGDKVAISSLYLNGQGTVEDDKIAFTVDGLGNDGNETASRIYVFHAADLPVVDDPSRELAASFEQWQALLAYTSKAPRLTQPEPFFDALEGLANWLAITPDDRQQLAKLPNVRKTAIGKLRGHAQAFLTPMGQLPPPVLFANHNRFKPIMQRLIVDQLKKDREVVFFVDWLIQCTPPPMVVNVLRDLIDEMPPTEHAADQFVKGVQAFPVIQSAPTWPALLTELSNSEKPALRKIPNSLRPNRSRKATSSGSPGTARPRSRSTAVKNPSAFKVLEDLGRWQLMVGNTDRKEDARRRATLKKGEGLAYTMAHSKDPNASYFRLATRFNGDFHLKFRIRSEPTKVHSNVSMRIQAIEGTTPIFHAHSPRPEPTETLVEVKKQDNKVTRRLNGGKWGHGFNSGEALHIILILRGEVTIHVDNIEVTPVSAVLFGEHVIGLRELDILKRDSKTPLDDTQLAERYGKAVVTVRSDGQLFGGIMISGGGLVLTHERAVASGAAEVWTRVGDKLQAFPATPLRVDDDTHLALVRFEPAEVLPIPSLARKESAAESSHRRIALPADDQPKPTVAGLVVSNLQQLGTVDRKQLHFGTPIFDRHGQLAGLIGKRKTNDQTAWIPLSDVLSSLIRWANVAGAERGIVRTWKDKSGQFEVVAQLVEIKKDNVTLSRESGERVEVPKSRLSDADQKLISLIEQKK